MSTAASASEVMAPTVVARGAKAEEQVVAQQRDDGAAPVPIVQE